MAKSSDKNVFDVSKPGKSAPSPTSRPIITSHGPMLKDPMVSDKQTEEKPVDDTPIVKTTAKAIKPSPDLKPEKSTDSEKQGSTEDKVEVKVGSSKEPETASTPEEDKATESAPEVPENKEAVTGDTSSDDVVNQALKPQETGPSKEELAQQQQIEGLVEAETYFLPIGQVTRRRNRRAGVVLIVILLFVVVGGYLALDAELIENSVELPFNIVK